MSNSFSSTPSSLSSSDIDANICSARGEPDPAGCLAGVLRSILCSGSLQTYPSDRILDSGPVVSDACHPGMKNQEKKCSSPGVVARLMGLDSLPKFSHQDNNQLTRSRSMNSVENSDNCDVIHERHRRVKSCMPIHMMPTFLELEDDKFIVLNFEDPSKGRYFGSKERKREKGFRELKQRRARCRRNKEFRQAGPGTENVQDETEFCQGAYHKHSQDVLESKVNETIRSPFTPGSFENIHLEVEAVNKSRILKYESSDGTKLKGNKRKKVNRVEHECSSEDSSPVSVLIFGQYDIDPEDTTSVQVSRLVDLGSRRKLSPELEEYGNQYPEDYNSLASDNQEFERDNFVPFMPRKGDCHSGNKYLETWGEICRLAGEDVVGTDWICRKVSKQDDYASISTEFGLRILDHLLDELIDQLSGLHMKL